DLRTTVSSNNLVTVSNAVWTGSSPPVLVKVETYQTSNSYYGQRLISEIIGTGSTARTNTYSYTSAGFLQQPVRSDRSWASDIYDNYNRPTNIFSGFLNQAVTTNRALCRLI